MTGVEDELRDRIDRADGSSEELRAIFAAMRAEVGEQEASRLWWASFAAADATET